jgi:hypothetical protein
MRGKITKFEINKDIFYSIDIMCYISDMISDVLHHRRLAQPCSTSNDAMCMQPPGSRTLNLRVDSRLNQDGLWDPP